MASIIECDDTPKRGAQERTETMATTVDPVEKKLDMSLDEIAEDRKVQPALLGSPPVAAGNASGKSRYTKRSDRLAQAGPYPPRMQRGNDVQYDGEGGTVPVVGRRVYVGNLSWSVQWQDLKDHMRAAGEVLYAAILESNGRSKGCGLVEFASEVEAARAIETLNDTELHGRKIFVREDRESNVPTPPGPVLGGVLPTPQQPPRSMTPSTRVYVGNLSWNVKWQDLKDHMKQAGNVMHADVLEEMNGRSKGCGLVEYSTPEEAQHAIATLNDTELEGRKIFVREDREPEGGSISSYARRGAAGPPRGPPRTHMHMPPVVRYPPLPPQSFPVPDGTSLYIGNLPWDVNWRSLKDLFRTVGEVDRAEVAQFPDGKSRGFGIVRFVYAEDAVRAIEQFNGFELNGRVIEVRYDKGRQEGPRP